MLVVRVPKVDGASDHVKLIAPKIQTKISSFVQRNIMGSFVVASCEDRYVGKYGCVIDWWCENALNVHCWRRQAMCALNFRICIYWLGWLLQSASIKHNSEIGVQPYEFVYTNAVAFARERFEMSTSWAINAWMYEINNLLLFACKYVAFNLDLNRWLGSARRSSDIYIYSHKKGIYDFDCSQFTFDLSVALFFIFSVCVAPTVWHRHRSAWDSCE